MKKTLVSMLQDPACLSIGNGCFLAEKSCKSSPSATIRPETSENGNLWAVIVIGIMVVIFCFPFCLLYRKGLKFLSCKRGTNKESTLNDVEEGKLLITNTQNVKNDSSNKKCRIEEEIFDQWKQDDLYFISTKACEEVEKNIKSRNLVIVAGHSGSGKSAIIQHIALKYREQGWTVKRVKKVEDIVDEYSSSQFQKNKTICVFNDPLGKESFDEILNNSWQTYEEELKLYLKTAKLMMSCRNHIVSDTRLTRYFVNQSYIVDIDDDKNKLSVDEKRQILTKYRFNMNLSDKDCDKIVKVERYFPLLCKLYSSKNECQNKGIGFFTEPIAVLKEEILGFRKKDKEKYCALALLVLFNDDFCVKNLLKNTDMENKFKHTLKLCGLPENTPPSAIGDSLSSLKGFFVKTIGYTYHFYHDFVMDVTTNVFGTDYPAEIIKFADIGFLRRRVRLENCVNQNDPFTIYVSDKYLGEELGERFFIELFRERLLDVVLNPCLRNETVIKVMTKKIADHPENLQMFLETNKLTNKDKQELYQTSRDLLLTKHSFLLLENEVSPLFALIVFCHTRLSQICLNTLQQIHTDFISCVPAVCCNGSTELFYTVFKDQAEKSLSKTWGVLFPIHIASVFHNYELLNEMIKMGADVNLKTTEKRGWTPLVLAAGNDTQELGDHNHVESGAARRDNTLEVLLRNGADVNLCTEHGLNPVYMASSRGQNTTLKLLLRYNPNINHICLDTGASPLHIACQLGHDETVQLLLDHGANINLCIKDEASPLYVAFVWRQYKIVDILLKRKGDTCLCNGLNPTYLDLFDQNDTTIKFLLQRDNILKNIYDPDSYFSLFVFCHVERMSRALFMKVSN